MRSSSQRERSQARKLERLAEHTHSVPPGKSILEKITDELDAAVEKYLDIKASGHGNPPTMSTARGEVRGLARALVIFAVPTYRDVKHCEKAAVRRVKEKRSAEEEAAE